MAINLSNNPLSAIKLGESDILKGYIGINQMFPNSTEITAAAFTNATTTNTAKNEPYVVSGEIGSSFTLTGSGGTSGLAGTQVISSSPTTYQIPIDANTTCGASSRSPQIVIAPVGSTVLAGGLSNTDTISQAAGPAIITNSGIAMTASIVGSGPTITIGGNLYWSAGAVFTITLNYTAYGSQGQSALDFIQFDCEDDSGNNSVFTPGNTTTPYYYQVGPGFNYNGLLRYGGVSNTAGGHPATQTYQFGLTLNAGKTTRYVLIQMGYGSATCVNTTPSAPANLQKFP